ncbi:putative FMN binding oxidoreductase [Ophiobolus disseminans]|uniref:Putative FMN binding oxidoreductase n=1 Tax=Ophiobolus disseminans TaxID=1469910 RepID=A0A6A6ZES5_9PLEO|nr:putative FMN binding oxidoreductase [Ophiobolus disseminans]
MDPQRRVRDPVTLPCGLVFKNRLLKAAMAENMSSSNTPTDEMIIPYKTWGEGGWGGILTGNVQIDERWLGTNNDLTFKDMTDPEVKARWRKYAEACSADGGKAIVQICHPGRQSPITAGSRGLLEKNVAPSAIALDLGDGILARLAQKVVFGMPREITETEIEELVNRYAEVSRFLSDVGFHGVELHGAHGYLLTLFMSAKTNHRTDSYGNLSRLVTSIIHAIRAAVPASFAIGIKLNSVDIQDSGDMEEAMQQIQHIISAGVDFLEISGGSYEDPKMFAVPSDQTRKVSERTTQREAYFLDYARAIRERFPNVVLMVTGGFRSLAGMHAALADNACDIIGIARPAVVDPVWARKLIDAEEKGVDEAMRLRHVKPGWLVSKIPLKAVGAGVESTYYATGIARMSKGLETRAP